MRVACLWFKNKVNTQKVAENCLRFSPQISIRDGEAIFIEIGKCRKLYSERGFLARVQVILNRLQITARVGIGMDITDALLIAKYQTENIDDLPLLALQDLADPFNKDAIVQKYVQKMIYAFSDLGIKNIGAFKRIPLPELVSRFGAVGILCRQRARSEMPIPWPRWKPDEIISEKTDFPYFDFYGEMEPLLFELKKHLDHIFPRLWARNLKAQSMEVKIFCETNSRNPKAFRKFEFDFLYPQTATKGTLTIMKERIMRDFEKNPIRTPIEGIQTMVLMTVAGSPGQRNFLHNKEDLNEQLSTLLTQLSETHGPEKIFQVELTEDRRPEKSWCKITGEKQTAKNKVSLEGRIPLRPTHLIRPERIEVAAGNLYIRKKPYSILKWSTDIERITGGWIEKADSLEMAYDRNYFRVDLEDGLSLSVFQTPDQNYYLHGYFG